jgi:uncharacterized protein
MRAAILTPSIVRAIAIVAALLAVEAVRADLDPSWLGAWIGQATPPAANAARPIATSIVVRRAPDGAPSAAPEVILTSLALGAVDRRATEVVADGRSLAFTILMGAGKVRIEAELAEKPISAMGSLAITKAGDGNQRSLPLILRRTDLPRDIAAARAYAATLDVVGQKLPMRLALAEGPHGWCATMDIPAQGLKDVLLDVARTDPVGGTAGFRITLASRDNAVMELTPSADMAVLEGTFAQGAFKGPIRFELADANAAAQRRPQDPAPNAPYSSIGVRIPHPAGHLLAGTLTIPIDKRLARAERFPAAVLVSGSGPQNRDEELMGHRPFAVIADSLARAGIAVLRYDDRGVGASTGDFAAATTVDFASDADVASEWLKARAEIDSDRVGMIGHSEGAWVAPLVAAWQNAGDEPVHPLAFTVLLAPPAESGLETLVRQTARMYEVSKLDPSKIARASAAQRAALRAARADAATLAPLVEALVRAQLALQPAGAATDAEIAGITAAAIAQITEPWMRAFIEYDPLGSLARGEVPTLAMWGAKDVQVVADANRTLLEKIASDSGAPLDARTYDGLNHLFQPAKTGLVDEYAAIDVTFDPNALAEMTEWIARTARAAPAKQIPEASRPKGWNSAPMPERPAVATKEPAP